MRIEDPSASVTRATAGKHTELLPVSTGTGLGDAEGDAAVGEVVWLGLSAAVDVFGSGGPTDILCEGETLRIAGARIDGIGGTLELAVGEDDA